MNDALFRTNPVWCLERLLDEWLRSPLGAIQAPARLAERLQVLRRRELHLPLPSLRHLVSRAGLPTIPVEPDPQPGVVGLLVDERERCGFVTPLRAERGRWHVPSWFPFREFHLQELLLRLIYASTLSRDGVIPERLSFVLSDGLGERSRGESMHVAGLLAILDEAAGRPHLLRRACAVVEPDGDRLGPVGLIGQKLEAFRRECGQGTLLVFHPDSAKDVEGFDFEHKWPVSSLGDLARHAQGREGGPDLLAPLLADVELSAFDVEAAHRFVREQMDRYHRFAPALDLSRRLLKCKKRDDVPTPLWRSVQRSALDLSRHLGYLEENLQGAQELADRLAKPETVTSYDEQADADTLVAAALFHLHRFEQIESLLVGWRTRLAADPLLVSPETRMKLINTLARSRIASGGQGWRELIDEALEVLADRDPTDRARTWCYLARGLLRTGDFAGARRALDDTASCPGATLFTRWVGAALEADLARRCGTQFTDQQMENSTDPGQFSLPLAAYLQATARQPGRADRAERFRRAAAVLRRDVGGEYDPGNLLHGLASLLDLAAASTSTQWCEARSRLALFLSQDSQLGLYAHYHEQFDALPDVPDVAAVERLLDRVPYF